MLEKIEKYKEPVFLILLFLSGFLFKAVTIGSLYPEELLGPDPYRAYRYFLSVLHGINIFPDCLAYVPFCSTPPHPVHFLYPIVLYFLKPLTMLLSLIANFFGLNTSIYNYENLVVLLANPFFFGLSVILYYYISKELVGTGLPALLFAVFPANGYRLLAGRFEKEPIASFLYILILFLYYRLIKETNPKYKILYSISLLVSIVSLYLAWGGSAVFIFALEIMELLRWIHNKPIKEFVIPGLSIFFVMAIAYALNITPWVLHTSQYASGILLFTLGLAEFLETRLKIKDKTHKLMLYTILSLLFLMPLFPSIIERLKMSNIYSGNRFMSTVAEARPTQFIDWYDSLEWVGIAFTVISAFLAGETLTESILLAFYVLASFYVIGFKPSLLFYLVIILYNIFYTKPNLSKIFVLSNMFFLAIGQIAVRTIFYSAFAVPILVGYAFKKLENLNINKKYIKYVSIALSILIILVYYKHINPITAIPVGTTILAMFLFPSISSILFASLLFVTGYFVKPVFALGEIDWIGLKQIFNKMEKDALITHWWDYGYITQYFANILGKTNRVTFLDGGNYYPYWNHLFGRYVLGTYNETEALELLYAHANFNSTIKEKLKEWFGVNVKYNYNGTRPTYLLIHYTDIGKSQAFLKLGSNENYDIFTIVTRAKAKVINNNTIEYILDFPNDDENYGEKCIPDVNGNYCSHVLKIKLEFDKPIINGTATQYYYIAHTLYKTEIGYANPWVKFGKKLVVLTSNDLKYAIPVNGTIYMYDIIPTPYGIKAINERAYPLRCVYIFDKKIILNKNGYGCLYLAPTIDLENTLLFGKAMEFKKPSYANWYFYGFFMNKAENMLWVKLYFFDNSKYFKFYDGYRAIGRNIRNIYSLLTLYNKHAITWEIQPIKIYKTIYPNNFSIPEWKRCIYLARDAKEILRCIDLYKIQLPKEKIELLKQGNFYVI